MGEKELAGTSGETMSPARAMFPAGTTAAGDAARMEAPGGPADPDPGPEPAETAIVKSKSNITNN